MPIVLVFYLGLGAVTGTAVFDPREDVTLQAAGILLGVHILLLAFIALALIQCRKHEKFLAWNGLLWLVAPSVAYLVGLGGGIRMAHQ